MKKGANVYHRSDGRWEARLLVGYSSNGIPHYKSFYGHSYKEAYNKFDDEIKKRNDEISEKSAELKQQSIFAFSKKKEIKAEIEQLESELHDFRKTEPIHLKKAYFGMLSE